MTTTTTSDDLKRRIARVETARRHAGNDLKLVQADPACADCFEVMFFASDGTQRYNFPCDFHRAASARPLVAAIGEQLTGLSGLAQQCQAYERLIQMWCDFPTLKHGHLVLVQECLSSEVQNCLARAGAIITASWKVAAYAELLGHRGVLGRREALRYVEEAMALLMRISAKLKVARERGILIQSDGLLARICVDLATLHHFVLDDGGGPDDSAHRCSARD